MPRIADSGSTVIPLAGGNLAWIFVVAAVIQVLTGYFTETTRRPVQDIGKTSLTGPATVVLAGIGIGLESAVYSALLIGGGVFLAYLLGGASLTLSLFAVAMAGTGLLTTVGVIVSMDTFGPVSDNAQGIAEMSGDVEGAGHLRDALGVVGDGPEGVHGDDDADGGEQTGTGQSHREQGEHDRRTAEQERPVHTETDQQRGVDGGFQTDGDTRQHDGRGPRQRGLADVPDGTPGGLGEVPGQLLDQGR